MEAVKINSKFKELYTAQTRYIYLYGGRGGAKSFSVADFIARLSFEQGQKILYTRYTLTAADKSIIPEFEDKLDRLGCREAFYVTRDKVVNIKTGVEILFSGIKTSSGNQTANLKSLEGITTWVYEEFEEHPDEDSFDDIDLSIRKKGTQNRVIMMSNALHKQSWQYKRFFEREEDITRIYTTYLDNRENLNEKFLKKAEETKDKNPEKYNKKFLGLHFEDVEGALWTWGLVDEHRLQDAPGAMDRIVVPIDPATTKKDTSDETGIVVVGRRGDHGYLLKDVSDRYSPNEWASKAIGMYEMFRGDRIVGEVNNGGDMIETTLRNQSKMIPYKEVRASRGKAVRAEPIVSLYEQGRIHHIGYFPALETELTTWVPGQGDSPNRLDALVWGFSELFGEQKRQSLSPAKVSL